jgi:hypothetical protein
MTAPLVAYARRLPHALGWAVCAYRYQRNKPHGVRATRYHAAMLAGMGAHIIVTGGRCWELTWLSPSYWLLRKGGGL